MIPVSPAAHIVVAVSKQMNGEELLFATCMLPENVPVPDCMEQIAWRVIRSLKQWYLHIAVCRCDA